LASAVPIDCLSIDTLANLLAMGPDGCQHQDTIFRDYSYSGSDAALVNATHRFGPAGMDVCETRRVGHCLDPELYRRDRAGKSAYLYVRGCRPAASRTAS
jgi:hypothetical protein